jgi:predicted nucleic acid-binding protein
LTCPIILQEILQGIRKDSDYRKVKDIVLSYPILKMDPVQAAIEAANLYRDLRKKGLTIRKSNDCLIASYAIKYNIPLLHNDSDFDLIASRSHLKIASIKI